MPDLGFVSSFVQESFSNVLISRGGTHFNFRCPFCGDSKKNNHKRRFHLQFTSETEIFFNCFNCETRGNFYDLYGHIKGYSSKEAFSIINKFNPELIRKQLLNNSFKQNSQNEASSILTNFDIFLNRFCLKEDSVINGFKEKILIDKLVEFKSQRGIENYPCYICKQGKFDKRIIIPIIENNHCVYFQGRATSNDIEPKYLNPSVEKENIILNKENFDRNKFIIITEGILDALTFDNQGTTCLGSVVKDSFLKELFKYTNKGVILALDGDETGKKKMLKIHSESSFKQKLLYFFLDTYKDWNEFHTKMPTFDLYKYVTENSKTYLEVYSNF